jgi:hypothetical protein
MVPFKRFFLSITMVQRQKIVRSWTTRVIESHFLYERQLPRNTYQSNSPTTGTIRKVLRTTLRSQTELESTHYQETETN